MPLLSSQFFADLMRLGAENPQHQFESSFDNYNTPGLTYLSLARGPSFRIKLYLFELGEWERAAFYVVHPHDHAYDFQSFVLAGIVRNHLFMDGHSGDALGRWRWKYVSRQRGTDRGGFFDPEMAQLSLWSTTHYGPGQSYTLRAEEIHTISIQRNTPTVLLIAQEHTRRSVTNCYLHAGELPPSAQGLYTPMSMERYAERLNRARELVRF